MAALQKIRSKGGLLILAIGVGLFAFIAEEFFRSMETTSNIGKQQIGEVYGEKLSAQEFQNLVSEMADIYKFQNGGNELNEQQMNQLREQVWNQFVQDKLFEHEAEELGLRVTDEEIQSALRSGTAQSLRMLSQFFGDRTGRFDVTALQSFLKQYKQMSAQAAQMDPQQLEMIQGVYKMWLFTEKQLRTELLTRKIGGLVQSSFLSNPIVAKMAFDERTARNQVQLAAIPYSSVPDKDIKASDEELKAKYDEVKEIFVLPLDAVDLKYIDVAVTASATDKETLNKEMQALYAKMRDTTDVAPIVNSSKSRIHYVDAALTKSYFAAVPDIAAQLDSMTAGSIKAPYYNGMDNTMNIVKLISKIQAPDSVLCRMIPAAGQTPDAAKISADSICKAISSGASFADLSKKYPGAQDSVWLTSNMLEGQLANEQNLQIYNTLNTLGAGQAKVISSNAGSAVIQVLDRKAMTTKYNVAIVKCSVDFSTKTYQEALNKFNRFTAANRTLEALEKNANKNGYILRELEAFDKSNQGIANVGSSKDAVKWAFDEAEKGDVSKIYECGNNRDHLLLVAVTNTYKRGYMPWNNAQVKKILTELVVKDKKAALLLNRTMNVRSMADASKQQGVMVSTLDNVVFANNPFISATGSTEPVVAGLAAKTAVGKFAGPVKGENGIYMLQVLNKTKGTDKYDQASEMRQVAGREFYILQNTLLFSLRQNADVVDNRYKF